ncbi:H(+)-myo-inositol cotransporter [Nannizzia gypsea CBS 118893]|uniref:H(+)-myo-inositol cotransporter n=1 Tax=Arthroderma gypseum (strain ATCC MYA-4604 / CBS 118893) TaxID=535722 RepID=E4UUJ9_ARTGP|nr:H(+)-myo-inositol cotransporter [Nannizzia gypsea CBS 118893]EFR00966.1 H(+)-myo-inositol cotransporter [Nannizzia gypsea CBS 118893]
MKLSNIFQRPPRYVVASILCSLGGFLFGVDTAIIGPVTVMQSFTSAFGHPSPTLHGLIVSSILIPAAISSFLAGRVADVLGRPPAIAIGSAIFGLGAAIEAAAVHLGMFVAGRVVAGIGEGLYLGTLVVYICEISPARHRGSLTTGPQLLITSGLVAGFFTCYSSVKIVTTLSWRLPFILLASYSATFAVIAYVFLPPSPRWLADVYGQNTTAIDAAWDRLGVLHADREDMPQPNEREEPKTRSKMLDVLSAEARPGFLLGIFLMGMQQLSGIDGVLYYAPLLFQQAGLTSAGDTFLASGVSAIVICAVTIPATIWADSWSRRRNTIYGGIGMATAMFVIGGLYAGDAVHSYGPGRWVVVVSIYIYTVIFSISWAVAVKIYAAEIQPQKTRASATSLAHGSNWVTNFLVALITPTLLANTSYGAYFLFGSCTLATAIVCWFFMPETRGRTLAEIQQALRASRSTGVETPATALWRRARRAPAITVTEN